MSIRMLRNTFVFMFLGVLSHVQLFHMHGRMGLFLIIGPLTVNTKDDLGYKYAGKNNGFWDIQEQMFVTQNKKF